MYVHWIDAKVLPETLTSIQNALQYSQVETEIILFLNEQTFVDKPLEGVPSDMWRYFMDHPIIPKCKIIKVTDNDKFWGVANFRRDFLNPDGLTYWGESDCMVPLECFYIAETIQAQKPTPFVLSYAIRKMWPGWEMLEHPAVRDKNLDDLAGTFWHCSGPIDLQSLYKANEESGEPEIVILSQPRIEGALTVLSNNLPEPLIAPTLDFFHEDYCLQLAMSHYQIPQYHVSNILKGHNNGSPLKRANIFNFGDREKNPLAAEKKATCHRDMIQFIQDLYTGKFKV